METVFADGRFIGDFHQTAEGELLGLLGDRDGRFRLIELGDGGEWAEGGRGLRSGSR